MKDLISTFPLLLVVWHIFEQTPVSPQHLHTHVAFNCSYLDPDYLLLTIKTDLNRKFGNNTKYQLKLEDDPTEYKNCTGSTKSGFTVLQCLVASIWYPFKGVEVHLRQGTTTDIIQISRTTVLENCTFRRGIKSLTTIINSKLLKVTLHFFLRELEEIKQIDITYPEQNCKERRHKIVLRQPELQLPLRPTRDISITRPPRKRICRLCITVQFYMNYRKDNNSIDTKCTSLEYFDRKKKRRREEHLNNFLLSFSVILVLSILLLVSITIKSYRNRLVNHNVQNVAQKRTHFNFADMESFVDDKMLFTPALPLHRDCGLYTELEGYLPQS